MEFLPRGGEAFWNLTEERRKMVEVLSYNQPNAFFYSNFAK